MKWYQHPYEVAKEGVWPRLRMGAWVSLAVTLTVGLVILPPYQLPVDQQLSTALLFGGITLVTSGLLSLFLPPARTVGRQLLNIAINFCCIGLANYLAMIVLDHTTWAWTTLLLFQGITLGVGALPVAVLTMYSYNQQLRRRLREAEKLNMHPHAPKPEEVATPYRVITLPSGWQFDPARLLAVEADKNYVRIYYSTVTDAFAMQQERMTLKAMTGLLQGEPHLLRVHRAFIVNVAAVEHVAGNAQGFRLRVPPLDFEVPVSRSYVAVFRAAHTEAHG